MPKTVIDCSEPVCVNAGHLARAALAWGQRHGKSAEEVLELALSDLLGNQLVDEELEENLIVSLADLVGCDTANLQHDFNKVGDEEDDDES